MAIFTVTSNAVENVDIFVDVDFKAGMALMRDDNGRVVKADNSLIFQKTLSQKIGKFLGFATSDHSSSANTIIVPDVIGSSYIDNSYNFIRTENNEVLTTKRALNDNLNESLNKPYNPSENMVISRRGLAVYNQPHNIFITDQFVRVLHGDYGIDFTTQIDFNSGDLLTFGSGINAGKLVKVNVNSISQEILIVGVIEKFIASTNLLHFRQVFYSHPFSNDSTVIALDAGNPYSYSNPSSLLANDLSIYNSDGTLTNGVVFSSNNGGTWVFDGTDDYISLGNNVFLRTLQMNVTIICWFYQTATRIYSTLYANYSNTSPGNVISLFRVDNNTVNYITSRSDGGYQAKSLGSITNNTWNFAAVSIFGTISNPVITYVLNNSSSTENLLSLNPTISTTNNVFVGGNSYISETFAGNISQLRIYNRALSDNEILAYYNNTKSRYGL
jgi:hypothetical protein